ncbi:MAG: sulfatase-like hydrolase/transferase, partial [Planctomycetales bacterium]|nr:sulfatase-like hydrolase/transferase [Planctomycetales bacterium]
HYKKRPAASPFFAIFNLTVSHESSLFPEVIAANRKRGIIPSTPRLDPAAVKVPPYLPDLPEIRSDIAIYADNITALDTQVGKLLDELESSGLADDTIVFYYGDHGGILPRGKRYLNDTGVRVPLLVRVPEKWRSLTPFDAGSRVDEPVSFVDLAPTVLSIAGIDKPARMQGRAFLGPKRVEPAADEVEFLYADR